jgi:hypothetical protein
MYNQIPASLFRKLIVKLIVETVGKKYRLRIVEGEVSDSDPHEFVEMNRHSRLYGAEDDATEAAESLFRQFKSVGWHLSDALDL